MQVGRLVSSCQRNCRIPGHQQRQGKCQVARLPLSRSLGGLWSSSDLCQLNNWHKSKERKRMPSVSTPSLPKTHPCPPSSTHAMSPTLVELLQASSASWLHAPYHCPFVAPAQKHTMAALLSCYKGPWHC